MDWTKDLIDLATAGGFAGLVWYLVVKHIPGIAAIHRAEREEWLAYMKSRDVKYDSLIDRYGVLVERCVAALESNGKNGKAEH
jgi:hypothetical protein